MLEDNCRVEMGVSLAYKDTDELKRTFEEVENWVVEENDSIADLDFKNTEVIDKFGLEVLVNLTNMYRKRKIDVRLVNISQKLRDKICFTNLVKRLTII